MKKQPLINFGFTLIELLVVISILGVLATLLISNVSGIRERARDAQRKNDVRAIQQALEMYKSNHTPPSYPATATWKTDLENGNYIKAPFDPMCVLGVCTAWPDYSYTKSVDDSLKYTLVACLENASDSQRDPDAQKNSNCSVASYTRAEP